MFSSIPMTLGSFGQEVFTRRHTNGSVKMEGKTLGFPVPVNQPAKEGVTVLTGVMDLIYQRKKKKGGCYYILWVEEEEKQVRNVSIGHNQWNTSNSTVAGLLMTRNF